METLPLTQSFFIIFREGFEIALILSLIFNYIKNYNNALCEKGSVADTRAKKYVYLGIVFATIVSFIIAWAFTEYSNTLTHDHEEMFEGITMIIASLMLFYVAIWCHGAKQHVEGKVDKAISQGAALALAFTVFFAIIREGFEIVLFYAAILSDSNDLNSILMGGWLGLIVLGFVVFAMNKAIIKMPIGLFFKASSVLLIVLALYFGYSGIEEIMEVINE
jgi:high-affinity iron transporter